MENTTRIADLPESQESAGFTNQSGNNYMPMNIHPNPYGPQSGGATNGIISAPLQPSGPGSGSGSNAQRYNEFPPSTQHQRLPSRDIRIEQSDYTNDDEIKANYIPKPQNITSYLNEYDDTDENEETAKVVKHKKHKKRVRFADEIFVQLQTPLLLTVIYYIFQMDTVNAMLKKFIEKFVKIYNEDGTASIYENIVKSVLFGSVFFAITKAETYFT